MIVLGLCIGEFCSAAIVADGVLLGASYEERFWRKKCYAGFPYRAVEFLLAAHDIDPARIDLVTVNNVTTGGLGLALIQRLHSFSVADYVKEAHEIYRPALFDGVETSHLEVFEDRIDTRLFPKDITDVILAESETAENSQRLREALVRRALGRNDVPVRFVEHHGSHALYGYLFAPADAGRCLILTADSMGDFTNSNVYRTADGRLKNVFASAEHNLGRLYRNMTLLLGMKPYQHEYKIMGLAPYAQESYAAECRDIFASYMTHFDGEWRYARKPRDHYFTFQDDLEGYRFDNVAGGLQLYFEDRLLEFFDHFVSGDGDHDTVIFSGGLSMNVKANLRLEGIAEKYGKRFFAAPSGDDYSHAISTAFEPFLGENSALNEIVAPGALERLDYGYAFGRTDIDRMTDWAGSAGWAVSPLELKTVARLLCEGNIFGLCQGRAEFGARALGFRSIIADPSNFDTIRKINVAIKQRDFWMPFAPAIQAGHETDFLKIDNPSNHRFMASAADTTPAGADRLKAATHPYDRTARPQIVTRETNALFHDIIAAFGTESGTHALLNTSLNLHGYPIVNDAEDLIFILENSNLDGCVLEDRILLRR